MKYLKSFIHDPYRITPETMVDAEYADKVFETGSKNPTQEEEAERKKAEAVEKREEVKAIHRRRQEVTEKAKEESEDLEARSRRLARERDIAADIRQDSCQISWLPLVEKLGKELKKFAKTHKSYDYATGKELVPKRPRAIAAGRTEVDVPDEEKAKLSAHAKAKLKSHKERRARRNVGELHPGDSGTALAHTAREKEHEAKRGVKKVKGKKATKKMGGGGAGPEHEVPRADTHSRGWTPKVFRDKHTRSEK